MPEPSTRYEQSCLRRKCEKILQQCEKLHQIRIPRPVLRMKALPSTKLCDSSSQQQCESKSGDTGSPSTELGDCSSQQQCESKIGVSLDKGTLASFFTSPAQSRCKDQSVAGEASKIGADGKKTKQLQQNHPGLRLQQLRLMSQEGKLSVTSMDKKARLNFDRAMLPGESMYTAEELREILRELPSWDSILRKEHPDVWELVDLQVEYMTDRTEAQRKSKQACYDRIYGGGVNPAGLTADAKLSLGDDSGTSGIQIEALVERLRFHASRSPSVKSINFALISALMRNSSRIFSPSAKKSEKLTNQATVPDLCHPSCMELR
eukprot:g47289.t1